MRLSRPFSVVSVVTLSLASHRDGDFLHLSGLYPLKSIADILHPWLDEGPPVRAGNDQCQVSASQVSVGAECSYLR